MNMTCANHPDRPANMKLVVDGHVTWVCQICYFAAHGEEEEDEG